MTVVQCVIDNRVFLLGLDTLYRDAMMGHERGELLECARALTRALEISPATVPVEGYYGQDPALTEYFHLLRALQSVDKSRVPDAAGSPEFRRLREIASARLYGYPQDLGKLLPVGRDPLSQALLETQPNWTVKQLTSVAADRALSWDDFSLVGLASKIRDPVVLAALRESVVLYAEAVPFCDPPLRQFTWDVDHDLINQATRFVTEFNSLFDDNLPLPTAAAAELYWHAYNESSILGRCVRLGYDPPHQPIRHYHWGICLSGDELIVQEFWHPEVWTTERYRGGLSENDARPLRL